MCVGGEGAALAGFEVHDLISDPIHVALAMMIEDLFLSLAQHVEGDAEAAVGGFGSGDRLKEKVDRSATFQGGELGGDMGEATSLSRNFVGVDQTTERQKNRADGFD